MDQPPFHFDITASGAAVFLGPTETRLMEIAWRQDELTVKKAIFLISDDPKPAYTTVMTIMNRLTDKGLLHRERNGRHFIYRTTSDRASFLRNRTRLVIDCLERNFPDLLQEMAG